MPRLSDDGQTVTLDLHGCTVDDALDLFARTLRLALQRGRSVLHVVHGHSTSDARARNRTIKHALEDELASGTASRLVSGHLKGEGHTRLALPISGRTDSRRLSLQEVQR